MSDSHHASIRTESAAVILWWITNSVQGLPFFHILDNICFFCVCVCVCVCVLIIVAILLVWGDISFLLVLICTSLMIKDVQHLFLCLLASVCLPWINV